MARLRYLIFEINVGKIKEASPHASMFFNFFKVHLKSENYLNFIINPVNSENSAKALCHASWKPLECFLIIQLTVQDFTLEMISIYAVKLW